MCNETLLEAANTRLSTLKASDPEAYARLVDELEADYWAITDGGRKDLPLVCERDYLMYSHRCTLEREVANTWDRMQQENEDFKQDFGYYPDEEEPKGGEK